MKKLMIAGLLTFALSAANADQQGLTLFGGLSDAGLEDISNDINGIDTHLGVGYQFAGPFAVELSSSQFEGVDATAIDAVYNFAENQDGAFYASLGAGQFAVDGANDEDFTALGLGMKAFITDNVAAKLGFKWSEADDVNGRDGTDLLTALSIEYNFGSYGKSASKPLVKKPAKVNTPVAAATGDADKDGVLDNVDQCLTTPAGVSVNAIGCELDSDKDGVVDSKDNCPSTSLGAKVDAAGCYIVLKEAKQIELNVKFASGSDVVPAEYYDEVQNVATFMKQYPNTKVTVEGHTDSQGAAAFNKDLSQRRANAIAALLVNKYEVNSSRVNAIGYGEAKPIATNDTAEGRYTNRRVIAVVKTIVEKVAQ